MNPISDYSVMGKLYLIFGGKMVAAYLSTIMLLGFVHASCFAMLENRNCLASQFILDSGYGSD